MLKNVIVLVLVSLFSFFIVLLTVYWINDRESPSLSEFVDNLKRAIFKPSENVTWRELFGAGLKTVSIVVIPTSLGLIFAYSIARYSLKGLMNILASFPEIFTAVLLWQFMNPIRSFKSQLSIGIFIVIIETIKTTGVFHKYFHSAYKDYTHTYTYYLNEVRNIKRRWLYTVKNVIGDSLGNMIFEIPLIVSSVAVLEGSLDFHGISKAFFDSIEYGQTDTTMRRSIVILLYIAIIQMAISILITLRDRRKAIE